MVATARRLEILPDSGVTDCRLSSGTTSIPSFASRLQQHYRPAPARQPLAFEFPRLLLRMVSSPDSNARTSSHVACVATTSTASRSDVIPEICEPPGN
jgi:hypothetical protein